MGAQVEPFKNMSDLKKMLNYWSNKGGRSLMWAAWAAYTVGTCSRWCETSELKICDISDDCRNVLETVKRPVKKKRHEFFMYSQVAEALRVYITDWLYYMRHHYDKYDDQAFFFSLGYTNKPHAYLAAYNQVKSTAAVLGIKGNYGTHSFRHTGALFRYRHVKDKTGDEMAAIMAVKEKLCHESIDQSVRYVRDVLKQHKNYDDDIFREL